MPRNQYTSVVTSRVDCLRRLALTLGVAVVVAGPVLGQRTVFVYETPKVAPRTYEPTPPMDGGRLSALMHELINAERARQGVRPLERDPSLDRISYSHSSDMGSRGYFDHVDLKGRDATQRAYSHGYVCLPSLDNPTPRALGENLFMGFRYSDYTLTYFPNEVVADYTWLTEAEFARETVDAWMDSPSHRANLLESSYHSQGIGIYLTTSLEIYVTQNLC